MPLATGPAWASRHDVVKMLRHGWTAPLAKTLMWDHVGSGAGRSCSGQLEGESHEESDCRRNGFHIGRPLAFSSGCAAIPVVTTIVRVGIRCPSLRKRAVAVADWTPVPRRTSMAQSFSRRVARAAKRSSSAGRIRRDDSTKTTLTSVRGIAGWRGSGRQLARAARRQGCNRTRHPTRDRLRQAQAAARRGQRS